MWRLALMIAVASLVVLHEGCAPNRSGSREVARERLTPEELEVFKLFGDEGGVSFLASSHYVELGVWDEPKRGDAYVTWLAFRGWGGPSYSQAALYVWNGEPVGRGKSGWKEVLRRMSGLRPGSRFLLYPYTLVPLWTPAQSRGGMESTPLDSYDWRGMDEVVVERNLEVILSPFDHNGRLHPDAETFWHYRHVEKCENCAASLEWKGFDGEGTLEEVIYIWDGKEVGKGLEGFIRVLSFLDRIKPGSAVALLTPGPAPYEMYTGNLLDEVVRRRNLIILYSEKEPPLK